MGERKLFKKSFSFPHTPYLSKTLKRGYGLDLHSAFKFYSVCHPERSGAKSNFCEVQRSKRAKAQGEAAAGSIMNFCYLSKTNVTFISKKTTKFHYRSRYGFALRFCSFTSLHLAKVRLRYASLRMTR